MRRFINICAVMIAALCPLALFAAEQKAASDAAVTQWSEPLGEYSYDGAGNITQVGSDSFAYDGAGRLTAATVSGHTQAYTYDEFGNRISASSTGSTLTCTPACDFPTLQDPTKPYDRSSNPWTVNPSAANNRLVGGGFAYDASGRMTRSGGGTTYEWTADDLLAKETNGTDVRQYIYNAAGERIAVYDVTKKQWLWTLRDESGRVLREYASSDAGTSLGTANWTWKRDLVYRGSQLLGVETPSGSYSFHLDHLGTPRLVVDRATGKIVGRHKYLPFGQELQLESPLTENPQERMKFTGHERDLRGTVGGERSDVLDYMHARYYSANAGRFLSVDRVQGSPGERQSWNRFSYARNNAIRRVDQDGNADVDFYVLMDPAKNNSAYNRQWFADRLANELGGVDGHTLRVSTDTRSSTANLRASFGREGGLVGYFGHSEGIHLTEGGYAARGLNPRGYPGQIGISNQQLTSMINRGGAGVAVIAACASTGCFAGGGLNGQTTVVALQSPKGLTDAIAVSGALEAFNNIVVKGNGTVAQGVAAANGVFKKYKLKDEFVVVGGDADRRLEKDQK